MNITAELVLFQPLLTRAEHRSYDQLSDLDLCPMEGITSMSVTSGLKKKS